MSNLFQIANQSPYPVQALLFVQKGLEFTARQLHGELDPDSDAPDESRHVSGHELCLGLKDLAVEEYGLMARTVLNHWRISSSLDFGRIVFLLVQHRVLHKTDDDRLEDFQGVFDFEDAFPRNLMSGLDATTDSSTAL